MLLQAANLDEFITNQILLLSGQYYRPKQKKMDLKMKLLAKYIPNLIKAQLMEKQYKNCQSCGMPLKRDEQGGGTNADGSKSTMYCSLCYENGKFLSPEIDTAAKMRAFVKDKLKSMGFPGFIAGFFTKSIPRLERWQKG